MKNKFKPMIEKFKIKLKTFKKIKSFNIKNQKIKLLK